MLCVVPIATLMDADGHLQSDVMATSRLQALVAYYSNKPDGLAQVLKR